MDREVKNTFEQRGKDGRDQGFVEMFGEPINLIDMRNQSNAQMCSDEPVGFQFDARMRGSEEISNQLSRDTLAQL